MPRLTPIFPLLILLLTAGCSPAYIIQGGIEQSRILLARQSIATLLDNPYIESSKRDRLTLVLDSRNFAAAIGLTPGKSYLQYVEIPRESLAWVVMATPPDSFTFHSWWYPIVGRVPYKGFFKRAQAECLASRLEQRGLETSVRGTDAMSTLGYFNDPILSTTLARPPHLIANTVIHEIFHATLWIPNHVAFNESAANFVGLQGAIDFFEAHPTYPTEYLAKATAQKATELYLTGTIRKLYEDLNLLYESDRPREEKLILRQSIFESHAAPLRVRFPNLHLLQELNNAEILQLKMYLQGLEDFELLFTNCNSSWPCFLDKLREIESGLTGETDPYELLRVMTQ